MNIKLTLAAAMATAALVPGVASADTLILDTGTPSSGPPAALLTSSSSYAAEFNVTAGETITELSAYLNGPTGSNDTFNFELYSAGGPFLTATNATREPATDGVQATFSGNGWNSIAVDWTPAPGTYWLALQTTASGLTLPVESSTSTGTAPATAFAFDGTNNKYLAETTTGVGMQVSAVPLPGAVWLLGSGLIGFVSMARRRSTQSGPSIA